MSSAWFIDALDADAGIAFASFRGPDLTAPSIDPDAPTVHIAAPDFSVSQLTSRALGLAAVRGSFQAGVFWEGGELGFAVLSDLVEFVRRAYIRRGGGSGPPGAPEGAAPFGPSPRNWDDDGLRTQRSAPDEVVRRPYDAFYEESWRETDATELLRRYLDAFEDASQRTQFRDLRKGGTATVLATPVLVEGVPATDPTRMLASGISEILSELIGRGPSPAQPRATWHHAVARIAVSCRRLGLDDEFHRIIERFPWSPISRRTLDEVAALTGELDDRFDDLARWPVTEWVATSVGLPVPFATVKDLFLAAVSTPTRLRDLAVDQLAVVVFAAVHLQPIGAPLVVDRSSAAGSHRELLVEQAWRWLRAQLPQRAFSPEVEDLLEPPAVELGFHEMA